MNSGFDEGNDADDRQPELLDLARATHRLSENLQSEGEQQTERKAGGGPAGNQPQSIWRIGLVGQVRRFYQ